MNKTEKLVIKAKEGDKAAFETLYSEFSDKVYFFALRNVGSEDTARDITSETFVQALEGIKTLRSEKAFESWLFSIAYKKCMDHLRVINRDEHYEDSEQLEKMIDTSGLDEPVMLPDDYAENADTAAKLKAVIDGMPADLRSAVLLYYYEDMSVSAVAKAMGISETNAKQKLFKARKQLRKKLEKLIGSGAVFAAVPLRSVIHTAFTESGAGLAVSGGAKVAGIGLTAKLAALGTAAAVAVGVPIAVHKTSGGGYRPEDENAQQVIAEEIYEPDIPVEETAEVLAKYEYYHDLQELENAADVFDIITGGNMKLRPLIIAAAIMMTGCSENYELTGENDAFSYGDISLAQNCDSEKSYEHFKIIDGAVETVDEKNVSKMRLEFDILDYLSGVDRIGDELLGDKYNKDSWNIYEHNPDPETDFTIRDGTYSDSRFRGLFSASDNKVFVFAPKKFDINNLGSFGDKVIDNIDDFFRDKSETLGSVKAQANKLIWLFDDSIGAEHSTLNGIYYHSDHNVVEFDFKQTVNGLEISSVPYGWEKYTGDSPSEELKRGTGLGRKSVFFNSNGDYYIDVSFPHVAAEPIEEYDEIITLDSALEYLDNNLAENLNYDMINAKLKYLVVTESSDNETYTAALPVWEFQLINPIEKQRYVCQINAVSGESSFVKIRGAVE